MLADMKAKGLKIAGYGASARGNTLITYYGIGTEYLDFLVDKNMLKHGLYSPNTRIPIKPVEAIETEKPDVLFMLRLNSSMKSKSNKRASWRVAANSWCPCPCPG